MYFRNIYKKITASILILAFVLGSVVSLYPFTTHAAINKQINYQGKLTNTSNLAVADGLYNMEFKLYTQLSGGVAVWTETLSGADRVQVTNGLFSTMLGSTTPLTGVDFNQTLYLGVNIESDGEMTPRKILGAVPAAFVADTLDNLSSEQFLRADASNSTSTASTFLTFVQSGAGKIAEFFGQASESVLALLSNGNVGIGTTTPYAKLSVAGSVVGQNFIATSTTATSTFGGSLAVGNKVYASPTNNSFAIGNVPGTGSLNGISATNRGSVAFGYASSNGGTNTILSSGNGSLAIGSVDYVSGTNSLTSSGSGSIAFGSVTNAGSNNITASGNGSFAGGVTTNGSITATQNGAFAFGNNINSTAAGAISFGSTFTNSTANTFQVGFSATPTLTVNATNIGIGTTSPYAKLSVVGEVVASHYTATTTATSTFAGGLQTNLLNVTSLTASSTFANGINLTAGCFSINGTCVGGAGGSYSDTNTNAYIHASSTIPKTYTANVFTAINTFSEIIATTATTSGNAYIGGNLGIGTTSPSAKLAVSGGNIVVSSGSLPSLSLMSTGTGGRNYSLLSGDTLIPAYAGRFVITDDSAGVDRFVINSTGNIGIGTTSPYAKLSVVGQVVAEYFTATSTTATSTFNGNLAVVGTSTASTTLSNRYSDNNRWLNLNELASTRAWNRFSQVNPLVSTTTFHTPTNYYLATSTTNFTSALVDLSGVTYYPRNNSIMVVRNTVATERLYEFTLEGTLLRTITLSGFTDTEGVTWMYDDWFAFAEEQGTGVTWIQIAPTATTITRSNGTRIDTSSLIGTGNLTLEGIAYDPDRDVFYISKEGSGTTLGVYQLTRDGTLTTLFATSTFQTNGIGDISDIYYDRNTQHLFFAVDQCYNQANGGSSTLCDGVIEVTLEGQILDKIAAPTGFTQVEGVGFTPDGMNMFMFGEPDMYAWYKYQERGLQTFAQTSTTTPVNATFLQTGNFGIGTSTPYAKLSVSGNGVFDDFVRASFFLSTSTATSTFVGGISTALLNVSSTTASSTFANGINLAAGCFSINGTCVGGAGGSYTDTNANAFIHASTTIAKTYTANTFTGLQNFLNASSSLFSVFNTLYVGGTATSTIQGNTTGTSTIQGFLNVAGTNSTSTFSGGLSATYLDLTGLTASSTFANGINLTSGCFSVNGTCVGGGTGSSQWTTAGSDIHYSSGKVGIGSSTPWATLSVVDNSTSPKFAIATSSGAIPLLFVDATTTGALDWARVGVGTSTLGAAGLRDQLVVAGRIYSTWRQVSCDSVGSSLFVAITTDVAHFCGPYAFDANTDGRVVLPTTAPAFGRLEAGFTTNAAINEGATIRTALILAKGENPVYETFVKNTGTLASSTMTILGFYGSNIATTTPGMMPANGVFFIATSTANWIAMSRNNNTWSYTNTGVATSTSFHKLRIELTSTDATFLIDNTAVAHHTSGSLPTVALSPTALVAVTARGSAVANGRAIDIQYIRTWIDDPPQPLGTVAAGLSSSEEATREDVLRDLGPDDVTSGGTIAMSYVANKNKVVEEGTLVSFETDRAFRVRASKGGYDKNLAGVLVSSSLSVHGQEHQDTIRVATLGRAQVRVSLENGPIAIGDYITSSGKEGVGMKATRSGKVIGRALESLATSSDRTSIVVNINPTDYVEAGSLFTFDEAGQDSIANLTDTQGIDWVRALRPVSFAFKADGRPSLGLLPEDVKTISTSLVSLDAEGKALSVRYELLPVVLTQAIKNLDARVTLLENHILNASSTVAGTINATSTVAVVIEAFRGLGTIIENGIASFKSIFADKVTTKELCLDDLCITKSELQALLDASAVRGRIESPDDETEVTPTETGTGTTTPPVENTGDVETPDTETPEEITVSEPETGTEPETNTEPEEEMEAENSSPEPQEEAPSEESPSEPEPSPSTEE